MKKFLKIVIALLVLLVVAAGIFFSVIAIKAKANNRNIWDELNSLGSHEVIEEVIEEPAE